MQGGVFGWKVLNRQGVHALAPENFSLDDNTLHKDSNMLGYGGHTLVYDKFCLGLRGSPRERLELSLKV